MKSELSRNRSLNGRLRLSGDRAVVARARDRFEERRDACATSIACLRDIYRAQIRLYDQLDICAARGGEAKRCLSRTINRIEKSGR